MYRVLHERSNVAAFSVEHQQFPDRNKDFIRKVSSQRKTKISDKESRHFIVSKCCAEDILERSNIAVSFTDYLIFPEKSFPSFYTCTLGW